MSSSFTITWKIDNFSIYFYKSNGTHTSDLIKIGSDVHTNWVLILDLKVNADNTNYIECFLRRCGDNTDLEKIEVDFKFQLLGPENNVIASTENKKNLFLKNMRNGFQNFISIETIENFVKYSTEDLLIVKCCIKSKAWRRNLFNECTIWTRYDADFYSFNWRIPYSFSSDWSELNKFSIDEHLINLFLFNSESNIVLHIRSKSKLYFTTCKLTLVDNQENELLSARNDYPADRSIALKFPSYILMSYNEELNNYTVSETFCLKFQFTVSKQNVSESVQYHFSNTEISNLSSAKLLEEIILDLRRIGKQCDIEIEVKNHRYYAHKYLLALQSSRFRDMFSNEKDTLSFISILDVGAIVFEHFLCFFYSGNICTQSYYIYSKLLLAAEKYKVPTLKDKCTLFLAEAIVKENVWEILEIADIVKASRLKTVAINYIKIKRESVMSFELWTPFVKRNSKLAIEILNLLSTDITGICSYSTAQQTINVL